MANVITRIDKFSIVYQPLTITSAIEVVQRNGVDSDGVSIRQTYDSIGGGYYPDYTMFPLVLQPKVFAYDPHGELGEGLVNVTKDVTNMKWYVIEGGEKTLLQSDVNYQIVTDNTDEKGRLRVKRNVRVDFPITLMFEADFLDTRTNDVHKVAMSLLVRSEVYQMPCTLSLDIPSQLFYNPWKNKIQTVHADIFSGDNPVVEEKRKCVWKLCADDGVNWVDFGSDYSNMFAQVSEDTMSLEINMEFMGKEIVVRCYGIVADNAANLALKDETSAFDYKQFKITRKLPKFNAQVLRFPTHITKGTKDITPLAQIDFVNFSTDNPEQELDVKWSTKRIDSSSFTRIGNGLEPTIPTNLVTSNKAQQVMMEVSDRGEFKCMADGNGNVLITGDGKLLMIR